MVRAATLSFALLLAAACGSETDAADAPRDFRSHIQGRCSVGETRPCGCPDGSQGSETCTHPDGTFSSCSCTDRDGGFAATPPEPPPQTSCGGTECAPYLEEDTDVGARGCCTAGGSCGSRSAFVFGTACVQRGGDVGTGSPDCPDEVVNFLDLFGCCRKDGKCGLSVDWATNFDLGCLERTEIERLLNEGSATRDNLSGIFLLPVTPAEFSALSCTPSAR